MICNQKIVTGRRHFHIQCSVKNRRDLAVLLVFFFHFIVLLSVLLQHWIHHLQYPRAGPARASPPTRAAVPNKPAVAPVGILEGELTVYINLIVSGWAVFDLPERECGVHSTKYTEY